MEKKKKKTKGKERKSLRQKKIVVGPEGKNNPQFFQLNLDFWSTKAQKNIFPEKNKTRETEKTKWTYTEMKKEKTNPKRN